MRLLDPGDDPYTSVVDYDREEKRTASLRVPAEQDVSEYERIWDELSPAERADVLRRRRDKA